MWIRSTTVLAISWLAATVLAQPANEDPISLEQALSNTLERNPSLVAMGYQFEARRGRLRQAGLPPNPVLDLEVENLGGTGEFGGVGGTETTLTLRWLLERGKRAGRIGVAGAELTLLESDAAIRRLDVAAATAQLFLQSLEYQTLLALAEESVQLSERLVDVTRRRFDAGRSPRADLARAEAMLAERGLVREDYEHVLATAIHRLAAQWGDTSPSFVRVRGNVRSLPKPVAFEVLRDRVANNPSLMRFLSEQRLREAEIRLAQTAARPSWQVRAGIRHLEQTGDRAFVAGITIPLGIRNRNQGRIAEASAALAVTEANRNAERIRLETRLFAAYQELQHALHIAEIYRDDVLPRIETALEETERAYAMGRYSYLELRSAQDDALEARTRAVVAAIEANRHLIEIERLTGTTLDGR